MPSLRRLCISGRTISMVDFDISAKQLDPRLQEVRVQTAALPGPATPP